MKSTADESWEAFLNPSVLRSRLIAAAIFISAFEALKDSIESRLREFFWTGFDSDGDKHSAEYREILARNRSPVYASLSWLRDNGAIDPSDVEAFENAKRCRNSLAHELLSTVASKGLPDDFGEHIDNIVELLRKIEVWWIVNVDLATDPEYVGREVNENEILPGPVMMLRLLWQIALGDEEKASYFYDEFMKRKPAG